MRSKQECKQKSNIEATKLAEKDKECKLFTMHRVCQLGRHKKIVSDLQSENHMHIPTGSMDKATLYIPEVNSARTKCQTTI